LTYGVVLLGSGALTAVNGMDDGNDIGGGSIATGNNITDFGTNGKTTASFGTPEDIGRKAAIQADGKIVQTGTAYGLGIAVVRYNADGTLDSSFGSDGKVITSIRGYDDEGYDIAVQKDRKIVVAGVSYRKNPEQSDLAVVRYLPGGKLDKTFGKNGKVLTRIRNDRNLASAIAIQSDGKIVVTGLCNAATGPSEIAVVRYNTDGLPDSSFDDDGIVTTELSNFNAGYALAVQPDGKIVVTGLSLADLRAGSDIAVVRYNTNGSLDSSFDNDGKLTTDIKGYNDNGNSVAIQTNGKIVIAGQSYSGLNFDFTLARYNKNGSPDTSFDLDGKVTTDIGFNNDAAYSVAIQPNGAIVAAGTAYNGTNNDFALVRYHADGSLDYSLNNTGVVTTDFNGNGDQASSVLFTPEGKIALAGSVYMSSLNFGIAEYNSYYDLWTTLGLYDETQYGCYDWPQSDLWINFIESDNNTYPYSYLGMQTKTPVSLGQICGYQSLVYPGNELRSNYTWDGSSVKKTVGYLSRNFKFTFTNNHPLQPAGIRLLVTKDELKKFIAKFNNLYNTAYTYKDVFIIRYDGINQDTSLTNNSDIKTDYTKLIPTFGYYGFNNEYVYLEFYTDRFSEFQVALSTTANNLTEERFASNQLNEKSRLHPIAISPNPAHDVVYIHGDNLKEISIFGSTGKLVLEANLGLQNNRINISKLSKGVYMMKITGYDNHVQTEKLIV
jgi:uncharacterized delta-60 repeat protein